MAKEIRKEEQSLQITAYEMIQRLQPRNALVFHCPNGEMRNKQVAKNLRLMGVVPGVADLVVLVEKGICAFIELKTKNGSMSKDQKEFQRICSHLGFRYDVCRSFGEVYGVMKDLGVEFVSFWDYKQTIKRI